MKITVELTDAQGIALLQFCERQIASPRPLAQVLRDLQDAAAAIDVALHSPVYEALGMKQMDARQPAPQINHELDDAIREFHDGPPGAEDQPGAKS
jgi:hypothetical protein